MNSLLRDILVLSVLLFFSSICGYCENTKPASEDWQIKGSLAAFNDPHPGVKALALDKLRELNAVDKFPIERSSDVVKLLENKDGSIRLSAVKFISQMGEAGHAHASEIVPLLKDKEGYVR
jgi:hypothetical protein